MESDFGIVPKLWECDIVASLAPLVKTLEERPRLCVFGASLVGQAISYIAPLAGFRVLVVDDCATFASREHLPYVDEIKVCPFEQAVDEVEMDTKTFVAIMTHKHRWDCQILAKVLRRPIAYVGMMGSRDRVEQIFNALKKDGFSECELGRVCAPIGLDIGGNSPGEIAISVVAQMIQVWYRQVQLLKAQSENMGSVPWDVLLRG
ncbi:MAG: XdhC family protein [Candidatus Latescibacterota bacterium]